MAGFGDSLDALWVVQKHDAAIVREQARIAQYAREVAAEQRKADAAKAALEAAREKLRSLKAKHKELEQELQRMDARAKQLDGQGTEAGSEAAKRQREKVDLLENDGLDLLMQVTAQETEVAKAEGDARVHEATLKMQREMAAASTNASQAVIEATNEVRRHAVAPIPPEIMQVYTEANLRNPGSALARLDGDYCTGCNELLSTQQTMQVRARAEILRCRHCVRILDAPKA